MAENESLGKFDQKPVARPWLFIPSLYFFEGMPYAIVNMMSVVFLKNLGVGNSWIGLTSFLYIPWMFKFLWAPTIDLFGRRRDWILILQVMLAVATFGLCLALLQARSLACYMVIFFIIAFLSATHDVAVDGYYLDVLNEKQQAWFIGIRSALYKCAWLFDSGALVFLAGKWSTTNIKEGWLVAFSICACVFVLLALWHLISLPKLANNQSEQKSVKDEPFVFARVFKTFFDQPGIVVIILFILIFRLGDAFMLKMAQPFLLDPIEKGGLGLPTSDVGVIYGTIGVLFLLVGGLVGGWIVARYGLKRTLLPTALVQNSAILLYWVLAIVKPVWPFVAIANGFEQFAYGLGTAAYQVFLLTIVKAEYRASHYAIATGLMAMGLSIPGAISGFLADSIGYQNLFLLSFACSIPGIICIRYLPFHHSPPPKQLT